MSNLEAFDPVAAARAIVRAYREGRRIPRLDPPFRARDLNQAFQIQDYVIALMGGVGGWKVGGDPRADTATRAPLFQPRILEAGTSPSPARLLGTDVEVEFAFRMGGDLPPRAAPYTRDEVMDAIDGLVPLIELVGGRFEDRASLSPAEQLADGFGAAVFIGAVIENWRALDWPAARVELWINGACRQTARDGHPVGDPVILVTWLANHLARREAANGLKRGQIVTTGGLAGITPIMGGERIEARYYHQDGQLLAALPVTLG